MASLVRPVLVGVREGLRAYRDEYVLERSDDACARALAAAKTIEGFTSPIELSFLYHAARATRGRGAVVEIGSFLGRSTVVLARASLDLDEPPIVAVDPHTGELTLGTEPRDTRDAFLRNLEAAKVAHGVCLLQTTSIEAARSWRGDRVRLLFVDGLHTYDAVLTDVREWGRWLAQGACVVLDDYLVVPSVRAAVRELVRSSDLVGTAVVVGKMIAFAPKDVLDAVPVPPAARALARLGDTPLSWFDRLFRNRREVGAG